MPRRRKHRHQIPENHRRKCEDTGTVKQVNHRHIEIPANWTSNKKEGFKTDFYLFKFLTNFYNLIRNDFDPRHNNCKKKYKSELLEFYLKEIDKLSRTYNQKLIFITFNLEEDLTKNPTWRYDLVTNFFKKMNFVHIDSYKILKNISSNNDEIKSYFGLDKHNNKKSFKYIVDELFLSL